MKSTLLLSAVIAGTLIATPIFAASDVAAGWQAELAALQQSSGQEAGDRARAGAMLQAALDASRHGLAVRESSGCTAITPPANASLEAATAQAAYSVLAALFRSVCRHSRPAWHSP